MYHKYKFILFRNRLGYMEESFKRREQQLRDEHALNASHTRDRERAMLRERDEMAASHQRKSDVMAQNHASEFDRIKQLHKKVSKVHLYVLVSTFILLSDSIFHLSGYGVVKRFWPNSENLFMVISKIIFIFLRKRQIFWHQKKNDDFFQFFVLSFMLPYQIIDRHFKITRFYKHNSALRISGSDSD